MQPPVEPLGGHWAFDPWALKVTPHSCMSPLMLCMRRHPPNTRSLGTRRTWLPLFE